MTVCFIVRNFKCIVILILNTKKTKITFNHRNYSQSLATSLIPRLQPPSLPVPCMQQTQCNYSYSVQDEDDLNKLRSYFFGDVLDCCGTSDETSPSGSDKTDLLTSRGISADRSRLTQMLVVTTTVRMVDGVHPHTGHLRESLSLSLELMEQNTCLHNRLLVSAATSDDADRGSAVSRNGLPGARRQSDSGLQTVVGMSDYGCVGA